MAGFRVRFFPCSKAIEEPLERGSRDYHGVDDMAILPALLEQRVMFF